MGVPTPGSSRTERRGRRWIFGTFVLCPCHLPLTFAAITSLLGGTAFGAVLHGHRTAAMIVIVGGWVIGTANGFRLVWHARRGTCPPLLTRLRTVR